MMNKRTNKGFTLIEILVAVGIIALLAGVAVVAFSQARKAARRHMASTSIHMISSGAEMFKNDFGVFPPSDLGSSNKNFTDIGLPATASTDASKLDSGAKLICALLTGYADDISTMGTFANWVTDDGAKGFGFRTIARGKVRGPYGGAEAAKTAYTENNTTSPKVFIDSWDNAILYYRYDSSSNQYNAGDNSGSLQVQVDDQMRTCPTPSSIPSEYKDARKDFLIVAPGDVEGNVDNTTFWDEAITNASVD